MRREIIGIILFFLVVFTLVSLVSYSPHDPSIHNATADSRIHNLFGIVGAHLSGALTGLFGLGAFWIPILLFLSGIYFLGNLSKEGIAINATGGILLIISTGSLFSLTVYPDSFIIVFGKNFSSGGVIGIPLTWFLVKYSNQTGALIILLLLWIIGFILATGFSFVNFFNRFRLAVLYIACKLSKLLNRFKDSLSKRKKTKTLTLKKSVSDKNSFSDSNNPLLSSSDKISSKDKQELKIEGLSTELNEKQVKNLSEPDKKLSAERTIEIKKTPATTENFNSAPKQEIFEFMNDEKDFHLPSIDLLEDPAPNRIRADDKNLIMQSHLLEKKLEDFGVRGKVAAISPGPVITTFEYEPAPGIKINKVVNLSDDLALALRASSIRIVAPIPGKAAIGIEIPNGIRNIVKLKEIIATSQFNKSKSKLTICLGKDVIGVPTISDLAKMPHLLIAGATGTGKSVALNAMICSLLYKSSPNEVKLIMIDPKRIELSNYDGIPHLITPVVTEVKKATNALFWAVREMEDRYRLLSEKKNRNISQYNKKIEDENSEQGEKLPYIVIIIDELADLMMVASKDVEIALARLAQMARAAGIHLILATQRPSVDVLTGVIKANFPTRLTFQVSSKIDSRTIIDTNGAENLLGNGDMLFLPPGTAKLTRIHGAYISEKEIEEIIKFLKFQQAPQYDDLVIEAPAKTQETSDKEDYDEKYDEAVAMITKTGQASISMIQRNMRIGYNRAARIIEVMEREGIVGPSDGAKPREVLVRGYDDLD